MSQLLNGVLAGGKMTALAPDYRFEMACFESQPEALACIRQHFAAGENQVAILFLDVPSDGSLSWANLISPEIRANCATVAIMEEPQRLPDIDRVIGVNVDSGKLVEVLTLVTEKLTYTSSPAKRAVTTPAEVGLIRKQHELLDYFKLRHRIYKIMGYLEAEIEDAPSQMEINWCDTTSLHFGAYARGGDGPDRLVGTARVVVSFADGHQRQGLLDNYRQWVTALVEQDPVLKQSVRKGVLPLELPIFQSQRLFAVFRSVLRSKQVCGELSRVIVVEDYRGSGLSTRLVQTALAEAEKIGVRRMFLECLPLHEGVYERLGFKRIEGTPGLVINVNQTMIPMELSPPLGASIATGGRA